MCGICGTFNFDAADPVDDRLVSAMAGRMAHRGPDDDGFLIEGNVGLGHRRLSIIDLAGGRQPIFNEDGSIAIVFNGEVYNYRELTAELESRGHRFRTRSDTEAIVHAYEQYGDDCVRHLRGMFAFAIWDQRRRRMLLARDRLGIKPLYYHAGPRAFTFASEIKSLLLAPGVPRCVDETALDHYLSLRYVPGPRTMFRDIWKLQPGHLMVVDESGFRIRRYWDIEYDDAPASMAAVQERFEQLLEESVRLRLVAEVPLGVFLSGGLDSSAILAVMSRLRQLGAHSAEAGGIKTFSVGYEAADDREEQNNEFAYARLAARRFGADHHEFRVRPEDFRDFIPGLIWSLDEPLADPSCIPLYYISRLARDHITVVLSGEGADEILAGYGIYRKMQAIEALRGVPLAGRGSGLLAHFLGDEKTRNYARLAAIPLECRYRGVSRGLLPEWKQRLTAGRIVPEQTLDEVYAEYLGRVQHTNTLNRMLYADAKVWLPDDLLLKADKMTMANALELRVPFLDHRLVEFAATLPPRHKLRGSTGKHLLRRAMEQVLPAEILHRPKKGFPVPTDSWLAGRLRDSTRDALLDPGSACRQFFDNDALRQLIDDNEAGRVNRHQELWTLLVFEHWHRLFVRSGVMRDAPELAGTRRAARLPFAPPPALSTAGQPPASLERAS